MIATILGLVVLIGGVAAGIILVKQQQDIREKAACIPDGQCMTSSTACCGSSYTDTSCGSSMPIRCGSKPPTTCTPGQRETDSCTTSLGCPGNKERTCGIDSKWGIWGGCFDIDDDCPAPPPGSTPTPYCIPNGQCMTSSTACCGSSYTDTSCGYSIPIRCGSAPPGSTPTPTPTPPPGATPTPTPAPGCYSCARCSNTKPGYWATWTDDTSNCDGWYVCTEPTYECKPEKCGPGCATPTPTPTPSYRGCGEACNDYIHCIPSLNCPGGPGGGRCVNGLCPEDPDCVCGATPTPRGPTPTPGETAVCLNIKAYDINWNQLTASQLSSLRVGNIVRFTVSGTPANKINKAKFRINGVDRPETSSKKPGTNEYYDEYTIPAGTTSFTVNAKLHHVTLGWF